MAVILNMFCEKYILSAEDIKSVFISNHYYIIFQVMQSFFTFFSQ